MDILIFSDLHYHDHPLFIGEPGEENPFVTIVKSVFKQIKEYINKSKKIDTVIFLGDLVHSRSKLNVKHIYDLQEFFDELIGKNCHSYILRGNPTHDGEGDYYVGNLLSFIADIINHPVTMGGDSYFFLPYDRKESLLSTIKEWEKAHKKSKGNKYLFMHYGLQGAKILDYEFPDTETLSKEDLKMFSHVFSGHFHKHQMVWENAWCVGSPYRVSFAERSDPKGFMVLHDGGDTEFIELDVPKMIEIKIIPGKNLLIKPENCFVKIIITGTDSQIKAFDYDKHKKELMAQGALGVKFETDKKNDEKIVREVRINKSEDPKSMVSKYLEFVKDQTEGLDIKKLKSIADEAMGGK